MIFFLLYPTTSILLLDSNAFISPFLTSFFSLSSIHPSIYPSTSSLLPPFLPLALTQAHLHPLTSSQHPHPSFSLGILLFLSSIHPSTTSFLPSFLSPSPSPNTNPLLPPPCHNLIPPPRPPSLTLQPQVPGGIRAGVPRRGHNPLDVSVNAGCHFIPSCRRRVLFRVESCRLQTGRLRGWRQSGSGRAGWAEGGGGRTGLCVGGAGARAGLWAEWRCVPGRSS